MAQTKRKRRTKHRGNAAGIVESRGRTGRKPRPEETRQAQREARGAKPPTWGSAAWKAGFAAAVLFVLVQVGLFNAEATTVQAIGLAVFAFVLYMPMTFYLDRFMWRRRQRMQQR